MKRDWIVAGLLTLLGLSLLYPPIRNPVVASAWHPAGMTSVVVLLAGLLFLRYDLTALVVLAIYLFLVSNPYSAEKRLANDLTIDSVRFDPRTSVDLQFANRTLTHDSPAIAHSVEDVRPLLLYPPSESTLRSMSG